MSHAEYLVRSTWSMVRFMTPAGLVLCGLASYFNLGTSPQAIGVVAAMPFVVLFVLLEVFVRVLPRTAESVEPSPDSPKLTRTDIAIAIAAMAAVAVPISYVVVGSLGLEGSMNVLWLFGGLAILPLCLLVAGRVVERGVRSTFARASKVPSRRVFEASAVALAKTGFHQMIQSPTQSPGTPHHAQHVT